MTNNSSQCLIIKLWNIESGELIRTFNSIGVNKITISPDGKTLASGSLDNTIKAWNLRTGKLLDTFCQTNS
ncbi:MAG: hypothetical protein AAF316_13025 [Cyanobacteria bacterium P01_A01_bin.80]